MTCWTQSKQLEDEILGIIIRGGPIAVSSLQKTLRQKGWSGISRLPAFRVWLAERGFGLVAKHNCTYVTV